MRPTDVAEADVYKGSERVGLLTRTSDGAEFRYDEAFAAERKGIGVALSLPLSRRRARVRGAVSLARRVALRWMDRAGG